MKKISLTVDLELEDEGLDYILQLHKENKLDKTFAYWISRISQGDMILNAEEIFDVVESLGVDTEEDEDVEEGDNLTGEGLQLEEDDGSLFDDVEMDEEPSEVIKTDLIVDDSDDKDLFDDVMFDEDEKPVVTELVDTVEDGTDLFDDDNLFDDEVEEKVQVVKEEPKEDIKQVSGNTILTKEYFDSKMSELISMFSNSNLTVSEVASTKQDIEDDFDFIDDDFSDLNTDDSEQQEQTFTANDFASMFSKLHG